MKIQFSVHKFHKSIKVKILLNILEYYWDKRVCFDLWVW